MFYFFSVWCVLAVIVLSMAGYRKMIARREDDRVHLNDGDITLVNSQKALAAQLSSIDKWGQILTIATVAFGLALGSIYLYNGWIASTQLQH
jgi:hypothetical protein